MRLLLSVLLLISSASALQRPLSKILQDRDQSAPSLSSSWRDQRVIGGLLDEHVSSKWVTLPKTQIDAEKGQVSFSFQLTQCNLEVLKTRLEEEVSNPRHWNYQSYMSKEEIDEFVSCGEPTEAAKRDIPQWLRARGILPHQIFVTNAYIHVSDASVYQVEALFPSAEMYLHEHQDSGKKLLRARGLLTMPKEISSQVRFVSGLTELQIPLKAAVKMPEEHKPPVGVEPEEGAGPYLYSFYQDFPIVPRVLRRLYNLRQNLTGGTASNNSMAIAAFDDFFYEEDLCYASDLFGRDPSDGTFYTAPTAVDYNGPSTGSDNGESSLDIQYATLLAPNVSTSFWNHDPSLWILSWTQQAINITTETGPWVWSVSYGWPEVAHCTTGDSITDPTLCTDLGLDYESYVNTANSEFMKLALMGVTVFVSSGDDGAPGFTIYCPVDPTRPATFGQGGSPVYTCPSSNPDDCKCGSFVLEYELNGTTIPCFLPMALGGDVITGQIGGLSSCTLLTLDSAATEFPAVMNQWVADINSTCESSWNPDSYTFGSLCTCGALPSFTYDFIVNATTNESIPVTLYGYQYNTSYAKSIFYSDFPTASPYVVSVGATQVDPLASGNACGQSGSEIYAVFTSGAIISGGGGFSAVAPMPTWQSSLVNQYLQNYEQPPAGYFNSSNRGYPDLSLNGHNFAVVVNRQVGFYDGTSASSPSLAAMFALINEVLLSYGKKPLGLITPLLYQMAVDEPEAFNKITSASHYNRTYGANNGCTRSYCCQYGYEASTSGWDPVTGLGTPNMMVIENYIRTMNGLPTIAQEAAAQVVTLAPTQAPTDSPTNAPTDAPTNAPTESPTTAAPTNAPTESPTTAAPTIATTTTPSIAPTSNSSSTGSASNAAATGNVPRTVTTAGAVTIGVLALFFGAVGGFLFTKFKAQKRDDYGYARQSNEMSPVKALL